MIYLFPWLNEVLEFPIERLMNKNTEENIMYLYNPTG